MDGHAIALVLGILFVALGAFMRFNKAHYSKPWKPVGLSKGMDPEVAKRLAKFQGVIVLCLFPSASGRLAD
jgi:hypothetical protein